MSGALAAYLLARPDAHSGESFSKLKAFLRRVGARTHEVLAEAIGWGLETITPQDAAGWFTHCGYPPAEHTAEETAKETVS